eukprot:2808190-Rhodomonas_salina.2
MITQSKRSDHCVNIHSVTAHRDCNHPHNPEMLESEMRKQSVTKETSITSWGENLKYMRAGADLL